MPDELQVVVLAAGRGRRFRSGGGRGHKALASVEGTAPLPWTVQALAAVGAPPLTVVVGYAADEVRAEIERIGYPGPLSFVRNENWETTDSAYSFALAVDGRGPVLLTYADVLVTRSLLRKFLDSPDRDLLALDATRPFAELDMRAQVVAGRVVQLGKTLPPEATQGESACLFRFRAATAATLAEHASGWVGRRESAQFEVLLNEMLGDLVIEPLACAELEWCEVDVPAELDRAARLIRSERAAGVRDR
jgi:choline kinase